MDPLSLIVSTLALGAVAGLKAAGEIAVKDAYNALKALIQRKYASVDIGSLEKDPASENRRKVLAEDLEKAGVPHDEEVLAKARELLEAVKKHDPDAARTIGVSLEDIEGASLTVNGVTASGDVATGVQVRGAKMTGDISIGAVSAGTAAGAAKDGRERKPGKTQRKSAAAQDNAAAQPKEAAPPKRTPKDGSKN